MSVFARTTWCKSLQTPRSIIANSVVAGRRHVRTCHAWKDDMGTDSTTEAQGQPVAKGLQFTAEESERFMRILAESLPIKRHYQLFLWLQGELQHILPHQILISAWGDFPKWKLKLDIISGLAGVR